MNIVGFARRHKFLSGALAVVGLLLIYLTSVAGWAYFETPRVLARIGEADSLVLRSDDLSPEYREALVAVEDPAFYSHHGIDISTPGAGWTTITQGVVKAYFFEGFTPGLLRHRKVKQSIIAWVFDRRVDKDTQLEIFINSVYMGSLGGKNVVGLAGASGAYYGKDIHSLSRDEYLSLVAMIVAPNEFNVARNPERNSDRVGRIDRMLRGECKPEDRDDVYYRNCAGDKRP